MKIIDLLNKIANGEEVPKKIKYNGDVYEYYKVPTSTDYRCYDEETQLYGYLSSCIDYNNFNCLNDEVEIIEEEKKIPEKLIPTSLKGIDNLDEKIDVAHIDTISAIETINEIIDYLKSKGE